MKLKPIPKLYSDSWLKALREALQESKCVYTITKHELKTKSSYGLYSEPSMRSRDLTDKEYRNLQIARALIAGKNE